MEVEYHCYPPGLQIQPYRRKIELQVANPDTLVLPCGSCLQFDRQSSYQAAYLVMESLQAEPSLPNAIELAELIRGACEISMNRISCGDHTLCHIPSVVLEGLFG